METETFRVSFRIPDQITRQVGRTLSSITSCFRGVHWKGHGLIPDPASLGSVWGVPSKVPDSGTRSSRNWVLCENRRRHEGNETLLQISVLLKKTRQEIPNPILEFPRFPVVRHALAARGTGPLPQESRRSLGFPANLATLVFQSHTEGH